MKKAKLYIIILLLVTLVLSSCAAGDSTVFIVPQNEEEALDVMQGLWFYTGENDRLDEGLKSEGIALDIDGELLDVYGDFKIIDENAAIIFWDSDTIQYRAGGEDVIIDFSFEIRDGYELMIWERDGHRTLFEKIDEANFKLYKGFRDIGPNFDETISVYDDLSDSELSFYISDFEWHELYYMYADGETLEMNPHTILLNSSDGKGIYGISGELDDVEWEVINSELYFTYEDGGRYYYSIDYAYDKPSGYAYLYFNDLEEGFEGCAWIFYTFVE